MKKDSILVPTVAQEVYKRLRNEIVHGELIPGQKITIRYIADSYGVSTMPVRESLTRLESEGFVSFGRRGVIINKLSIREVQEIFAIRKNLEVMALEWAIKNINQSDLEELERILKEMDSKLESPNEWETMNKKFHLTLYSYANSKPLKQVLKHVWGTVEAYMHIYSSSKSTVHTLHTSQEEHYQMLAYLKEGQLEELTKLTLHHLQITCDVILRELSA